jgi:fumarate reductase flavoprotein subunit
MVPACGTKLQAENDVDDSVKIFAGDITAKAKGQVDKTLVDAIAKTSGPTIDWLMVKHNIEFTLVKGFLYPGHRRLRMHAPASRKGSDLIAALASAVEKTDAHILTEAYVSDLYVESTRVTGVRIERPNGSSEAIGCDALILACNGYGGNPEMLRKYIPDMAEANYSGHVGNQGDAVTWGLEMGAATKNLGAYQGHGSVAHPHAILITWALMTEGGIQVNSAANRFSNEHDGYSEQGKRVMSQENGLAWDIYDQRLHKLGLNFEDYREAEKLGAVHSSNSIEELAEKLSLPNGSLAETLEACQQFTAGKAIDPFGRDFTANPPLCAPYFGIKVTGSLFHTQGGLAVNDRAQVLQADGTQFPNLFAAGGAAAGISGPADWGYLSGNGLLTAFSLGRLAGQSAAELVSVAGSI